LEELEPRGKDRIEDVPPAGTLVDRVDHGVEDGAGTGVVRGEEAGFLVGEVLIEGLP